MYKDLEEDEQQVSRKFLKCFVVDLGLQSNQISEGIETRKLFLKSMNR